MRACAKPISFHYLTFIGHISPTKSPCRIIGEEKLLSIKVGAQAKLGPGAQPLGVDEILIRGPSSEVDRAVTEIIRIVEDAKNDEIDNGFVRFTLYCSHSFRGY